LDLVLIKIYFLIKKFITINNIRYDAFRYRWINWKCSFRLFLNKQNKFLFSNILNLIAIIVHRVKRKLSSFILLGTIALAGLVSFFLKISCKDVCWQKEVYILMGAVNS